MATSVIRILLLTVLVSVQTTISSDSHKLWRNSGRSKYNNFNDRTDLNGLSFSDTDLYRFRKILPKLPIENTPLEDLYNLATDAGGYVEHDIDDILWNAEESFLDNIISDEKYRTLFLKGSHPDVTSYASAVDENIDPEDIPGVEERNQAQGWEGCRRDYDMVMLPETEDYHRTLALVFNDQVPPSLQVPVPNVTAARPVAIQMVDANGRRPAGFWQGDLYWIGAVELCFTIGIRYQWNGTGATPEVREFKGKAVRVDVPLTTLANQTADTIFKLAIGLCAPDTCTDEDIQRYVGEENMYLLPSILRSGVLPSRSVTYVYSGQNPDLANDPLAIVTFSAILVILLIIVIASCYDGWGRESIIRKKIQGQSGRDKNRPFTFRDVKEAQSFLLLNSPTLLDRLETLFAGFSAYTNFRRIYTTDRPSYHIPALDGLKCLAYIWLVFATSHLFGIYYFEAWTNHNGIWALPRYLDQWSTMVVVAVPYANSALFYIGGFVCVQMFYKAFYRNDEKVTFLFVVRYFLHRYWSFLPTLAALLMVYTLTYRYIAEGPLMSPDITDAEKCRENWWLTLLMWHNLFKLENQCMAFTYFFAVLWQLNLVSIIVLIPLVLKPFVGYLMALALYITHIVMFSIWTAKYYDGDKGYFFDILQTPWCHAGPYVIGMVFAMIIKGANKEKKWHWASITALWMLSVTGILVVVFAPWDQIKSREREWSRGAEIAFEVLAPQLLALSAGWVTFACWKGYGGVVDKLLRWGLFTWMSRMMLSLTIGMGPVMQLYFMIRHQVYYVNETHIKKTFYAHLMNVFLAGNIIALALTYPLSRGVIAAARAKNRMELFLWATHPELLDQFTGDRKLDAAHLLKLVAQDRKKNASTTNRPVADNLKAEQQLHMFESGESPAVIRKTAGALSRNSVLRDLEATTGRSDSSGTTSLPFQDTDKTPTETRKTAGLSRNSVLRDLEAATGRSNVGK